MVTEAMYKQGIKCRGICQCCKENINDCYQYITDIKGTKFDITPQDILVKNNVSDIYKLLAIFEIEKDSIKQYHPELYYALLAIRDDVKHQGYKFEK